MGAIADGADGDDDEYVSSDDDGKKEELDGEDEEQPESESASSSSSDSGSSSKSSDDDDDLDEDDYVDLEDLFGEPAASSAAPAPPPAPPHFEPPSGAADVVVVFPGVGRISYYSSTKRFYAVCLAHHDRGCVMTRTARPMQSEKGNKCQGRPLGLLVAWLHQAAAPISCTFESHRCKLARKAISHDTRLEARQLLSLTVEGLELLSKERVRRIGEPEEPLGIP